jgi:hypothetical protein
MVPSRSGGSRKSPKHPFTKNANARGPARFIAQPASRDRVPRRSQLLFEDHILDPLPGLEQPAVFDLAVELTAADLMVPSGLAGYSWIRD